ncbi:hypothetical protein GCM10027423_33920 [Spirosoma arcticum]
MRESMNELMENVRQIEAMNVGGLATLRAKGVRSFQVRRAVWARLYGGQRHERKGEMGAAAKY